MPTLNYVIVQRAGPFDSLENAEGSPVQTTVRRWSFTVTCSFHENGHTVTVPDPYTATSVKAAVQTACKAAYQVAPEVGLAWSQTF